MGDGRFLNCLCLRFALSDLCFGCINELKQISYAILLYSIVQ